MKMRIGRRARASRQTEHLAFLDRLEPIDGDRSVAQVKVVRTNPVRMNELNVIWWVGIRSHAPVEESVLDVLDESVRGGVHRQAAVHLSEVEERDIRTHVTVV